MPPGHRARSVQPRRLAAPGRAGAGGQERRGLTICRRPDAAALRHVCCRPELGLVGVVDTRRCRSVPGMRSPCRRAEDREMTRGITPIQAVRALEAADETSASAPRVARRAEQRPGQRHGLPRIRHVLETVVHHHQVELAVDVASSRRGPCLVPDLTILAANGSIPMTSSSRPARARRRRSGPRTSRTESRPAGAAIRADYHALPGRAARCSFVCPQERGYASDATHVQSRDRLTTSADSWLARSEA